MTTETKKPSDLILGPPNEERQERYRDQQLHFENLVGYLDDEAERRAKFEQDITERVWALEGKRPAPEGIPPMFACPCGEHMPEAEERVLFYVPGQRTPEQCWRVGHWDNTARAPRWWDAETASGDEPILYKPEQVTHWMPLPGDPA